eukprot:COSAG04_NODE_78_length_28355_cov_17.016457_6_plen_216_part_00
MAALGDSLVDNPVGPGLTLEQSASESKEDDDDDAELELVADVEHLRRLGALLSNAEGGASALTKAAHAVLVAAPLWMGLKGAGQAADPALMAWLVFTAAGALFSGPAALRDLQRATRRSGGTLAGLGAGAADVLRSHLDNLRWWRRLFRCLAICFALFAALTYGVYEPKLYDKIEPVKVELNATVTTAAEVRALRLFPSFRLSVIASPEHSAWRW